MLDFLGFLLAASLVVGVIAGSLYIGLRTSRPYWRMFNTGTQVERLVRLRKLVFGVFLVDLSLLPFVITAVVLGLPSIVLIVYFAVLAPAGVGAVTIHVGTKAAIKARADARASVRRD